MSYCSRSYVAIKVYKKYVFLHNAYILYIQCICFAAICRNDCLIQKNEKLVDIEKAFIKYAVVAQNNAKNNALFNAQAGKEKTIFKPNIQRRSQKRD